MINNEPIGKEVSGWIHKGDLVNKDTVLEHEINLRDIKEFIVYNTTPPDLKKFNSEFWKLLIEKSNKERNNE